MLLAWDATASASCQLQVQIGKGAWTEIPCPPGTVILVSPATSEEARVRPSYRTVARTGDAAKDNANADDLVTQLRSDILAVSGDVAALGGCDGQRRNITGSYVVGVSGQNPARV